MAKESEHLLGNYNSLPVMTKHAEGVWVTDVEGKRYIDGVSAYSANNFGHRHPEIIAEAHSQLDEITLISRAFMSDQLGPFTDALSRLAEKEVVLPMNTGAEGVESGLKILRKWGNDVKGVPEGMGNIVVGENNFHGRTISIVSFSSDQEAYFGPYTPGFRPVEFGNIKELEQAVDENTVGVLLEPVQGEAGIIIPPDDYLPAVREICTQNNVKLVIDEIQSGFGRTGKTFASEHWDVVPDAYIFGKALGGGVVPLSAVVGDRDLMEVIHAGEHGSTFGGNPLAAAIGSKVINLMNTGWFQRNAQERGAQLSERLEDMVRRGLAIESFRCIGFWAGVDIDPKYKSGRQMCEDSVEEGLLIKDTHGSTVRLSPPLSMTEEELDLAMDRFESALEK